MEAFKNQVQYIDMKQKISEAKPEEGPLFFKWYISYNVRYAKYRGEKMALFSDFGTFWLSAAFWLLRPADFP